MEVVDNKYKRWGWGALLCLIAVIVIAAIVVGVSSKNTPVKTVEGDANSSQAVANNSGNSSNSGSEGRDNEGDAQNQNGGTGNSGNTGDTSNSGNTSNSSNTSNTGNTGNTGSNNSGSNTGNSNTSNTNTGSTNTNNGSKMPKTGPEDDMIAFVAWAAIAGLGAYYFLNSKKNA